MKKEYIKPTIEVFLFSQEQPLLTGSDRGLVRGSGITSDIDYGGEGEELDPE